MTEDAASAKAQIHEELKEERMTYAVTRLHKKGWKIIFPPDLDALLVISPLGRMYYFWPETGEWKGKKSGRGISNLIKAGEETT